MKKSDKKLPKNLSLQAAYALKLARPACRVQWIKAHDGSLWNEYADRLAVSRAAAASRPSTSLLQRPTVERGIKRGS